MQRPRATLTNQHQQYWIVYVISLPVLLKQVFFHDSSKANYAYEGKHVKDVIRNMVQSPYQFNIYAMYKNILHQLNNNCISTSATFQAIVQHLKFYLRYHIPLGTNSILYILCHIIKNHICHHFNVEKAETHIQNTSINL